MSNDPSLAYRCGRCGNCCRWPGDVRLTDAEIGAIARFLDLEEDEFIASCTRLNASRSGLSLKEKANGECLMLEGANTCRIHPVKPAQCRDFPNRWRFPGWRQVCEAMPERPSTRPAVMPPAAPLADRETPPVS